MEQIELRPIHCASISGGKDSLYMMLTVLNNLDKYPLDCVVHWDLEIDWDWSKQVVNDIEQRLKKIGVPMYRIKPSRTWQELYDKYNMPSRVARWCNSGNCKGCCCNGCANGCKCCDDCKEGEIKCQKL